MFNEITQPVYTKQLGVAFFIFAMGWGLTNSRSPRLSLFFNRLFPIYFFGLTAAIVASIHTWVIKQDLAESNYLPFILGVNVLFNAFPANPSTWYIGTYIHLVILWCLFLYRLQIRLGHVLLTLLGEVIIRALLIDAGTHFIAYMIVPNWLTLFLLGCYMSDVRDKPFSPVAVLILCGWLGLLGLWAEVGRAIVGDGFPFRAVLLQGFSSVIGLSALISAVYLVNTLAWIHLARYLPALRIVEFFSRNTLVMFIIHMPVIFGASSHYYALLGGRTLVAVVTWIVVVFVGTAMVSEVLQRLLPMARIKAGCWTIFSSIASRIRLMQT
jgi:hypothetical protein